MNNLLKTLEYIKYVVKFGEMKNVSFFNYIYQLKWYITSEGAIKKYIDSIRGMEMYFSEEKNVELLFNVCRINLLYYHKIFDSTFKELEEILSFASLKELSFTNKIDSDILYLALQIYSYEGFTLECVKFYTNQKEKTLNIYDMFFYLGEYREIMTRGYYFFEKNLNENTLIIEELEEYVKNIYPRDHLEKMQTLYTLSKVKKLSFSKIDKLVITNPYTKGLKNLMFAFIEVDKQKKTSYFEVAIDNLHHIKYYYIEAIYYYTQFLKSVDQIAYQEQFKIGYELAKKHQYRFLIHQFNNLQNDTNQPYNQEDYLLNVDFDFDDFVKEHNATWANKNTENKKPIKRKNTQKKKEKLTNKPPQKPALYVEGPTDKKAILSALEIFQSELVDKIEIICELDERQYSESNSGKGGGINWVKKRITGWLGNGWKVKAAALFDSDDDGIAAYNELKKSKDAPENKTSKNYVDIFKLSNAYQLAHLAYLKKLGIIIPVALEEMFPKFCWEYASGERWLEKRTDIDDIVRKSSNYDAKHDGTNTFLSKNELQNELYLKCIPMKHKQKFMNYISGLSDDKKREAFQEFESITQSLAKFFS